MRFPYDGRPRFALWKSSVEHARATDIDPFAPLRFTIGKEQAIASAGSCFARHIASSLRAHEFNYLCTEPGAEYSANFGNIYTTLQLRQLFARAYGEFVPAETAWKRPDGRYVDPQRPRVFAEGFASPEEVAVQSQHHLSKVRELFERLEVFVFTLGLTEGFCSTADGTAFPACPGKDFGEFDDARYAYRNLGVAENVENLSHFLSGLRTVNPGARVILTVSPVPLVATLEDRSVVQSTVYSKSVLRVAADEIRRNHENVEYFWSYEIVTATYNNDRYFDLDRRSVNQAGVAHVMRSFFRHFAGLEVETGAVAAQDPCDEDVLNRIIKQASR